jgi:hypothetical protein
MAFRMSNIDDEILYTVPEIAEAMKLDRVTVFRWVQGGVKLPISGQTVRLEAFKVGKQYKVLGKSLRAFLERMGFPDGDQEGRP